MQQPFPRPAVLCGRRNSKRMRSVIKIRKKFYGFLAKQRKWEKLMGVAARMNWQPPADGSRSDDLTECRTFGRNPGNLRMFMYLPPDLSANCALMVVLHGC